MWRTNNHIIKSVIVYIAKTRNSRAKPLLFILILHDYISFCINGMSTKKNICSANMSTSSIIWSTNDYIIKTITINIPSICY